MIYIPEILNNGKHICLCNQGNDFSLMSESLLFNANSAIFSYIMARTS